MRQVLAGKSYSCVAMAQGVSKIAVFKIVKAYREFGWEGLKDHKTGRPETVLSANASVIIFDLRKRFGYGACRIEQVLKQKGFSISHRQIERLLVRRGLVEPNVKKQKPRKWVRYELPNPNDLWHTDWTYDPYTQQQLSVFIDDRTRLIVSYAVCKRATAENSVALLKAGIASYGKPRSVMTDHGAQYYANRTDAKQENTQFLITLDALSIKHYIARVNRPQTNGKVERWFLTYKTEYATGTFTNIKDFIQHYNNKRPHMSLHYKTPQEVWNEFVN